MTGSSVDILREHTSRDEVHVCDRVLETTDNEKENRKIKSDDSAAQLLRCLARPNSDTNKYITQNTFYKRIDKRHVRLDGSRCNDRLYKFAVIKREYMTEVYESRYKETSDHVSEVDNR